MIHTLFVLMVVEGYYTGCLSKNTVVTDVVDLLGFTSLVVLIMHCIQRE